MARQFTAASSEYITTSIGAMTFAGTRTTAAIVKLDSGPGINKYICYIGSAGSGTARYHLYIDAAANGIAIQAGNTSLVSPTITVPVSDGWCLVAATKTGGTNTPRFHKVVLSTGTASHENASTTLADETAPSTTIYWGRHQAGSNYMNGSIAIAAGWNVVLTDSQIEALAYDLTAWWQVQPKGLWLFDQSDVTQKLLDLSGGGANESGRSGTSVSTSSVVGWSYGHPIIVPTLSPGTTYNQTLTANVSVSSSLVKSVGKVLTATTLVSATAAKSVGKTLTATTLVSATAVKSVGKTLTGNVSVSATAIKSVGKTLTASVNVSATALKQVGKTLTATTLVSAMAIKSVGKTLTANTTVAATLAASRAVLITLTANVTVGASLVKSVGKTLTANVSVTASAVKSVGKTLTATTLVSASAAKSITKTLTANVVVGASLIANQVPGAVGAVVRRLLMGMGR